MRRPLWIYCTRIDYWIALIRGCYHFHWVLIIIILYLIRIVIYWPLIPLHFWLIDLNTRSETLLYWVQRRTPIITMPLKAVSVLFVLIISVIIQATHNRRWSSFGKSMTHRWRTMWIHITPWVYCLFIVQFCS